MAGGQGRQARPAALGVQRGSAGRGRRAPRGAALRRGRFHRLRPLRRPVRVKLLHLTLAGKCCLFTCRLIITDLSDLSVDHTCHVDEHAAAWSSCDAQKLCALGGHCISRRYQISGWAWAPGSGPCGATLGATARRCRAYTRTCPPSSGCCLRHVQSTLSPLPRCATRVTRRTSIVSTVVMGDGVGVLNYM